MAWNKEDISFKTLLNKRITNSSKRYFEEFGDFTLDISASEIKSQEIPLDNPTLGISNGVVKAYTLFTLTKDNTVDGDQSYYALDAADSTRSTSDNRLRDWISDKWGSSYSVKLYDANNNLIPPTHNCQWLFNSITGILIFNGDTSSLPKPFKITGYRYIGKKGVTSGVAAGISIAYADLKNLIANNKLDAGSQYLISDFKTIHIIPGETNTSLRVFTSAVEPLYVRALTNNSLEGRAVSALYPTDFIVYDSTKNVAEDTTTTRPGKIIFRADPSRNISAYFDWRNVNFRRWIRTSDSVELTSNASLLSNDGKGTYAPSTVYNQTLFTNSATISNVNLPSTLQYGGYNNVIFKSDANGLCVTSSILDTVFYGKVTNSIIGDCASNIFYSTFNNNKIDVIKSNLIKGDFSNNIAQSMQSCKADFDVTYVNSQYFDTNILKSTVSKINAYTFSNNIINAALTNCKFSIDINGMTYTTSHTGMSVTGSTAAGKLVTSSFGDGGELNTTLIIP